jgi:hypothetical protein
MEFANCFLALRLEKINVRNALYTPVDSGRKRGLRNGFRLAKTVKTLNGS